MHRLTDGSWYEGDWADGQRTTGTLHEADSNATYKGQWEDMQPHGQGTYYIPGVLRYTGELWHSGVAGQAVWAGLSRACMYDRNLWVLQPEVRQHPCARHL